MLFVAASAVGCQEDSYNSAGSTFRAAADGVEDYTVDSRCLVPQMYIVSNACAAGSAHANTSEFKMLFARGTEQGKVAESLISIYFRKGSATRQLLLCYWCHLLQVCSHWAPSEYLSLLHL